MAKFIALWEVDTTKLPEEPEEQISLYIEQLNMVGGFEKRNPRILEWGQFAGSYNGYLVYEGTPQGIDLALAKFSPYAKFTVYPLLSVEEELENVKKLSQA